MNGVEELRFRAMGTGAHVLVVDGPSGAAAAAARRIDQLERRWSRFRPDSDVSELNRRAGQPVRVTRDTALLVERAVAAYELSGGAVDATVLGAVIRAGYDRSFDDLVPGSVTASDLLLACSAIEVDGDVVRLPGGTGFDPGGIGKGLAADLVVEAMLGVGAAGACVNLGGDVRVAGSPPDGSAWTVAIEHPTMSGPLRLLGLAGGAVATSTTLLRTWHRDGERAHHIIDPATGRPSDTDLTLASVVTGEAWTAEVLAKAVLLRGAAHPFDLLDGSGAEALAVDRHGHLQETPGMERFR